MKELSLTARYKSMQYFARRDRFRNQHRIRDSSETHFTVGRKTCAQTKLANLHGGVATRQYTFRVNIVQNYLLAAMHQKEQTVGVLSFCEDW